MSSAAAVLLCALDILGRSAENFPTIRVWEQRPGDRGSHVEAFVTQHDRTIHLIADSPAFSAARRSAETNPLRCKPHATFALLASILVHEEWHLLHGDEEDGAYAAQLTALLSFGFAIDSAIYRRVMLARLAVLDAQRHRRPVTPSRE
jgi:hypothetical protein